MMLRIAKAIRNFVVPVWLPYAAGAFLSAMFLLYVHSCIEDIREKARIEMRNAIAAEQLRLSQAAQEKARRRELEFQKFVYNMDVAHKAELDARDVREAELTSAWADEVKKNKDAGQRVCWPASVVKELRK